LLNHSMTVKSLSGQIALAKKITAAGTPFILGETNSLYNQGAPGLSDSFGAALWGIDFNLWSAVNGISRVHMHQGTDYRYASWQPITTEKNAMATKAAYYGNIAVAAFIGDASHDRIEIVNTKLDKETEAQYSALVNGKLKRYMIINMESFNYTGDSTTTRPVRTYNLSGPAGCSNSKASISRLLANGSNAASGVTWDGYSFDFELKMGKPVLQPWVKRGETARVGQNGMASIAVPVSSAAVVTLDC
jgi:hypothetical protein